MASGADTIGRERRADEIALAYMRAPPPIDLVGLAGDLGLHIKYEDMGDQSGKIERLGSGKEAAYQITLNDKHPLVRQRFTLAHEIAHFVKHRKHLDAGGIVDNAMYRSLLPEPLEWEANRYAAMLLMPLSAMQQVWREGHKDPASIARRLQVSEQAASIRLQQVKAALQMQDSVRG